MKTLFFALLLSTTLSAQSSFWQVDFTTAQEQSTALDQNIVIVFSGSDWCGPCLKMERDLWSQADFQDQAKDQYLFVKADFPRRRANQLPAEVQIQNEALAERYNLSGSFPLIVVLSPTGLVLGKTGYKNLSPTEFLELLNSFSK